VFVHWPTLHRAWRAFGPVGDRAREQLLHTRFIVLDDLGRERAWGQPDAPDPVYEDVFCLLSDAGKTVICTTNFSAARLFALFTDRVLSRFKGGWGQFFSAAGEPDYRLTKPWERQP
jgi:hypothetical protein